VVLGVALVSGSASRALASEPSTPRAKATPPRTPFGAMKLTRSAKLVVDFSLSSVAPEPIATGSGLFGAGPPFMDLGCTDSPTGELARAGASHVDDVTGLRVDVTVATPAGRSGRGWEGARCEYRISDLNREELWASLGDVVPAFSYVSGIVRSGDVIFVQLGFNGYPKEVGGRGNFVVALDLAGHRMSWRSKDMSSNAAMILVGDYLVTGYGFTKEKAALHAFDRVTGELVQSLALPKAPAEMLLTREALFVRLYDGYARVEYSGTVSTRP
jgi:hypothetical protein